MIVAPEITAYLDSLEPGNAAWLEALRREAETAEVPVLRRNTERFLKMLLLILKPQELLEVGTAVGYSALVMASVLPENAHITTIESWAPRIEAAQRNISRSVYRERITPVSYTHLCCCTLWRSGASMCPADRPAHRTIRVSRGR